MLTIEDGIGMAVSIILKCSPSPFIKQINASWSYNVLTHKIGKNVLKL